MSAHVAVLDADGRIREVNQAWGRFAAENSPGGYIPPSTGVGADYVRLCRMCTGEKSDEAELAADGLGRVAGESGRALSWCIRAIRRWRRAGSPCM